MLRISPHKIKTVGLPAALLLVIVLFSGQLLAAPGHAERPGDCTSGSTINLNNWRSAPLLSPNVLENAISSFSPGFLFAPTVTDHKITPGPIPSACVSPNGKTNYLQTDPTVYQWTLINGGSVGDVIQWQFFAPGTLTPYSQQQTTLNFSGAACFWAGINIAGQSAASLLGTWQVRVLYNGSLLLTDSFTINSSLPAVTVSDHRVSSGPIPANCIPPVNQTSFLATEAQIYEWILFTGVQTGDVIRWEFVQPNGTVYQAQEFTSTFSGASGCFWSSISLAGQAAASLPGNWQVKVYYNTVLKQTDGGRALEDMTRRMFLASSAIAVLQVPGRTPLDYLEGGRILQRVWLAATGEGVAVHPQGALVYSLARLEREPESLSADVRDELTRVRDEYRELVPANGGADVLMLRLSVAPEPSVRSLRRPLGSVLSAAPDARLARARSVQVPPGSRT